MSEIPTSTSSRTLSPPQHPGKEFTDIRSAAGNSISNSKATVYQRKPLDDDSNKEHSSTTLFHNFQKAQGGHNTDHSARMSETQLPDRAVCGSFLILSHDEPLIPAIPESDNKKQAATQSGAVHPQQWNPHRRYRRATPSISSEYAAAALLAGKSSETFYDRVRSDLGWEGRDLEAARRGMEDWLDVQSLGIFETEDTSEGSLEILGAKLPPSDASGGESMESYACDDLEEELIGIRGERGGDVNRRLEDCLTEDEIEMWRMRRDQYEYSEVEEGGKKEQENDGGQEQEKGGQDTVEDGAGWDSGYENYRRRCMISKILDVPGLSQMLEASSTPK